MSVNRRGFCAMACAPDGRAAATGGLDGAVRLWDLERASALREAPVSSQEVFALAWDSTGRRLAAGTGDGRLLLLDGATLDPIVETTEGRAVMALGWRPDGSLAVGAMGGRISIRNGDDLSQRQGFDSRSGLLTGAVSPDGSAIYVSNPGRRISLTDGSVLAPMPGGAETHAFAVSRDGRLVAVTHWNGELRLWREGQTEPLSIKPLISTRVPGPQNAMPADLAMPMTGVAISPDGAVVAAAAIDRRIRFWSTDGGELLAVGMRLPSVVSTLGWTPDGARLCMGDLGGVVRLWPTVAGLPPENLRG